MLGHKRRASNVNIWECPDTSEGHQMIEGDLYWLWPMQECLPKLQGHAAVVCVFVVPNKYLEGMAIAKARCPL